MLVLRKSSGFTIVELLIVVVVIAILAAITIVAYNGISSQAKEAALKSDLSAGAKQLQLTKVQTGSFPSDTSSLKKADTTTFTYTYDNTAQTFCLSATSTNLPGKSYRITDGGTIEEGDCTPPAPTTMQAMTSSYCATMTIYTGSNPSAIITLTDSRGGTTRSYEVAKLADNNCWMLTNLKLGSTTGTITLTPVDSNVASNFTLPQLITTGSPSYDTPQAIGPVPGDTGSGATNYGYLYNFPAATAGETTTSLPVGTAQYSICPAGWRLPTGRDATGDFAFLNAKMNNPSATAGSTSTGTGFYQNWQYVGPSRSVFSGRWFGSFANQGSYGYLWSASARSGAAINAHNAAFTVTTVYPGTDGGDRSFGFGVRCLLQ